jgi:hypothetical protein
MKFNTHYLDKVLYPARLQERTKIVSKNLLQLKKVLNYDAIAFRGYSGAGMAFPVSYLTGLPLMLVRKTNLYNQLTDNSHGYLVEGDDSDITNYVILDDFIASGETVRSMIQTINHKTFRADFPVRLHCVGVCLYNVFMRDDRTDIDGIRIFDVGASGVCYSIPG